MRSSKATLAVPGGAREAGPAFFGFRSIAVALLAATASATAIRADSPVALNRVQMIGSHNSFKGPIDAPLLEVMSAFSSAAERLDYRHLPLPDQLALGLRAFEIDVYHDPQGGAFARPIGIELMRSSGVAFAPFDPDGLMLHPGFKVLHVPDIDFRSNCPTLALALAQFKTWSLANPTHAAVVVTMNVSDKRAPIPGGVDPPKIDVDALNLLDEALKTGMGEDRLLTPDLVRQDAATLESAVLNRGWPSIEATAGKFLFVLDEGGAKRAAYIADHPGLRGRVMFTDSPPGTAEAAFRIINDPVRDRRAIQSLVARGYMVRTRADAETLEARANNRRRFDAAIASGAQVISTDYYLPDERIGPYQARFDDGGYVRYKPVTPLNRPLEPPP